MTIKKTFFLITLLIFFCLSLDFAGAADLIVTEDEPASGLYQAPDGDVIAGGDESTCTIRIGKNVIFAASGTVTLKPGFHAKTGSKFHALVSNTTDTDADGMHDWWEIVFGLDPQADDAALDLDGDGLTNAEEFANKTLPHLYEVPEIMMITDHASIPLGESVNLSWDIKYAETGMLSPGNIAIEPTGSLKVTPQDNTTYIITATGPGGTNSRPITIDVTQALPRIIFKASFSQIYNGGQTTLSWVVVNAPNATLNNGIGEQAIQGEIIVSPTQTTTYELTATNGDGASKTAALTISVLHHKPIITFSAAPIIVTPQNPITTLTWSSINATQITIDGTPMATLSGSKQFTPTGYHEYTLVATGPGGTTTASLVVGDSTDTDNDGMPDAWEDHYGMDKNQVDDANADFDGDLLTNAMEYQQGLDPYEYNVSDLELSGNLTGDLFSGGAIYIGAPAGQQTVISGDAKLLANCTIVISPEVRILPGSGTVTIRGGDCDLLPDEWELLYLGTLAYDENDDPDGDGLINDKEYLVKGNPAIHNTDNDADNLNDIWELEHFGDLNQSNTDDADNDGIDNWTEKMIGSDPNDPTDYPKPGNYYEYDAVGRIKRIIRIK